VTLKEDPRYDYLEAESEPQAAAIARMYSRPIEIRKGNGSKIMPPTGRPVITDHAALPMQSYLQRRFSHITGSDYRYRLLRAENQRRHDHCASLGHWPMSRTS
jgi:hypothetical protein